MDIQEIDIGNTMVRSCLQGSARLVISFEFVALGEDPSKPAWAQDIVTREGWDGLYIMPKVLDWYQNNEIWEFFYAMKDSGFFEGYDSVVTYGNSLGGFAALAFSTLCGAERVVAMQPRTTLRWGVPWPSEMSSKLDYNRTGPHADALGELDYETEFLIFADPFFARDWAHASRVPGAQLFEAPFSGHIIPEYFTEIGIFYEVARRAINGELTASWYEKAMQAKTKSAIYQRGLAAELNRRGEAEGAVIEQGIGQLGPDPEAK